MSPFANKRSIRAILSAIIIAAGSAGLTATHLWSQTPRERPALPFADDRKANVLTRCGDKDDSQHVEFYDGKLGVSKAYVDNNEGSTLQLQWVEIADIRAKLPGYQPGDVPGRRWCSGTLLDDRHVLTAGHCFDELYYPRDDWTTPWKRDASGEVSAATPQQLATLMKANFNYQLARESGATRTADVYPVVALREWREGPEQLDYAIIKLGTNEAGQLPGSKYEPAKLSVQDPMPADLISVIQHPDGKQKMIEVGKLSAVKKTQLWYGDLDTFGGSSGSGVRDKDGTVIGVHTNGGCTTHGGNNKGVKAFAINEVSKLLSQWSN